MEGYDEERVVQAGECECLVLVSITREEATHWSPSTCGRIILSSRVATSMSTSAGRVDRHCTSCSKVSCARDCSSRFVVSLLAYLQQLVVCSLARQGVTYKRCPSEDMILWSEMNLSRSTPWGFQHCWELLGVPSAGVSTFQHEKSLCRSCRTGDSLAMSLTLV